MSVAANTVKVCSKQKLHQVVSHKSLLGSHLVGRFWICYLYVTSQLIYFWGLGSNLWVFWQLLVDSVTSGSIYQGLFYIVAASLDGIR